MIPPTGLDLLAVNVRHFWRALGRLGEHNARPLYVSLHSRMVANRGPDEYLVGTYTRHAPLADLIADLEAHLNLKPAALHGVFKNAERAERRAEAARA